jgi:DNA-binding response OmpR family regulator
MMSGFELDEEDRNFCLRQGVPHLTKPFLSEELLKTLDSLVTRSPRAGAQGA